MWIRTGNQSRKGKERGSTVAVMVTMATRCIRSRCSPDEPTVALSDGKFSHPILYSVWCECVFVCFLFLLIVHLYGDTRVDRAISSCDPH